MHKELKSNFMYRIFNVWYSKLMCTSENFYIEATPEK